MFLKSPFHRTLKNLVLKIIIFIAAIFIGFSPKSTCQSLSHFLPKQALLPAPKALRDRTIWLKSPKMGWNFSKIPLTQPTPSAIYTISFAKLGALVLSALAPGKRQKSEHVRHRPRHFNLPTANTKRHIVATASKITWRISLTICYNFPKFMSTTGK